MTHQTGNVKYFEEVALCSLKILFVCTKSLSRQMIIALKARTIRTADLHESDTVLIRADTFYRMWAMASRIVEFWTTRSRSNALMVGCRSGDWHLAKSSALLEGTEGHLSDW